MKVQQLNINNIHQYKTIKCSDKGNENQAKKWLIFHLIFKKKCVVACGATSAVTPRLWWQNLQTSFWQIDCFFVLVWVDSYRSPLWWLEDFTHFTTSEPEGEVCWLRALYADTKKRKKKKQHLVVLLGWSLSLQSSTDQMKIWKVTGNSTVCYVALNTVQSVEEAQPGSVEGISAGCAESWEWKLWSHVTTCCTAECSWGQDWSLKCSLLSSRWSLPEKFLFICLYMSGVAKLLENASSFATHLTKLYVGK